jgi:lysophospholipase L1-like esterase
LASYYKQTAEKYGCEFLDAALVAEPSDEDSVHMLPEGHRALAEAVAEKIEKMFEK